MKHGVGTNFYNIFKTSFKMFGFQFLKFCLDNRQNH